MRTADLHIHTHFSDGTFTPERAVKEAAKNGLACIAITDHDEVSAIKPAIKEGASCGVEVIPGIELSAEEGDYEIHILGYLIDWSLPWFGEKLIELAQVRRNRALAMLEKLKNHGILLDPDELMKSAEPGSVGRLHIARMLYDEGFVFSIQEAFNKYIGNNCPCYVKKFQLTTKQTIEMIRNLGGVAVLAHPHSIGNDDLIEEFAKDGLGGIEVFYPEYTKSVSDYYSAIAEKFKLVLTGGSDCHGLGKARILMGEVKIPYKLVEVLKERANKG